MSSLYVIISLRIRGGKHEREQIISNSLSVIDKEKGIKEELENKIAKFRESINLYKN